MEKLSWTYFVGDFKHNTVNYDFFQFTFIRDFLFAQSILPLCLRWGARVLFHCQIGHWPEQSLKYFQSFHYVSTENNVILWNSTFCIKIKPGFLLRRHIFRAGFIKRSSRNIRAGSREMILFSPRILAIELLLLSILFLRSHLVLDLLFSLKSFNFLILHIFLLAKKKATHTKRYFSWLEVNSTAKKEYDDGKKKKLRCGCLFKGWTMTIFLLRILYEERENRQNGKHLTKLKIKKRDKKLLPSPSYCELTRSCNHYNHTRRNSSARETFLIKGLAWYLNGEDRAKF